MKMLKATEHLQPHITVKSNAGLRGWRGDPKYFYEPAPVVARPGAPDMPKIKTGSVALSPAWYQLGHGQVSRYRTPEADVLRHAQNPERDAPETSLLLKPAMLNKGAGAWLTDMAESHALLNAAMRVMHPAQYQAGKACIDSLLADEAFLPAAANWTSTFNAVQILSNRWCPPHRDTGASPRMYDLLVTLGQYRDPGLHLPGLGLRLQYLPGTLAAFSGHAVRHGVEHSEGHRVCYAYFQKRHVMQSRGIEYPGWMKVGSYS